MRSTRLLIAAALLAACSPMRSHSGALAPSPNGAGQQAVSRLKPGDRVRFAVDGGARLTGEFVTSTSDSVVLATSRGQVATAVASIDSLWIRSRPVLKGAARGATTLGIVMGSSGLLAGWALGSMMGHHATLADGLVPGAYMAGIGIAVGGGVGALIGAVLVEWRLEYAR